MTKIIKFPVKASAHNPDEQLLTDVNVSELAAARLASQAASSASSALLDLSLCVQDFHEGKPAEVSAETVTSLVEALRLAIFATGCRNQDRALITALCVWSESTKGETR